MASTQVTLRSENLFDHFKLRAEAVSAEVYRFAEKTAALDFILQYLREAGVSDRPGCYAVWADCRFLQNVDCEQLAQSMPGLAFDVTREKAAAAKVGISQLDWAMASTGSLVQSATAVELRLVSTLPTIHIALVPGDRIVRDFQSVFANIRPEQASYISFITGPSRTADIERVLTIGVHGPEKLIIVFFDEPAEVA